jgi:hypothetical protein
MVLISTISISWSYRTFLTTTYEVMHCHVIVRSYAIYAFALQCCLLAPGLLKHRTNIIYHHFIQKLQHTPCTIYPNLHPTPALHTLYPNPCTIASTWSSAIARSLVHIQTHNFARLMQIVVLAPLGIVPNERCH